ncbi:DUF2442 domain-containing protein [Nodosilinea sp. P-1105]|uniref:DUF2442 domain-containing protein n=1 Tax=Nodosilinea sp. P-1105 TaxID=2546229 RepID=UPI00146D2282|nr:DUF2442 domain-containing protein [Nodosilinea sp. P-1105]NMF86202.1 hypothetical protein [Nodosilinea sp. P-1105]
MSSEELKLAESVVYDAATREVVVALRDGSRHAWPVRLLEMVQSEADAWLPLARVTDEQLAKVEVYGGGQYILWDELGQVFKVSDLLAGVYGREEWMKKLMAMTQ